MHALKGFSLIELMVVIAIVAVLSAVAVPAYKDYSARTRIADATRLLDFYKNRLIDYYNKNGTFPPDQATFATAICGTTLITGTDVGASTNLCPIANVPYISGLGYTTSFIATTGAVRFQLIFKNSVAPGSEIDVDPANTYNRLFMGLREINGTMTALCSGYDPVTSTTTAIPARYRPAACQGDGVLAFIST